MSEREHAWSKPAQSAFARRHLSNSAAIETGRTARRQVKRMSIVGGGAAVGEDSGVAEDLQGSRKDAARLSQPYSNRPFSSAYKGLLVINADEGGGGISTPPCLP